MREVTPVERELRANLLECEIFLDAKRLNPTANDAVDPGGLIDRLERRALQLKSQIAIAQIIAAS